MRHLGILAHSIEGPAFCLLDFCRRGVRELGPHDHPDVTLDSIAMARSMPAWESGDYASIRATFATQLERLAKAGAEFFILPDNTGHLALELPGPDFALPGLHIAEVVAERALRDGHRRIGVLGTKYTMDGPVYRRALGGRGLEHEIPGPDDRAMINRIIFDELVAGIFTDDSRRRYVRVIEELRDRGCDAVALVCTEIPILIRPEDSPLPTLASTTLLSEAALEVALGRRPLPTWRGGPLR